MADVIAKDFEKTSKKYWPTFTSREECFDDIEMYRILKTKYLFKQVCLDLRFCLRDITTVQFSTWAIAFSFQIKRFDKQAL